MINDLAKEIHAWSREHGFWNREVVTCVRNGGWSTTPNQSIVPEKLMLIVTEVAEAMEDFRDDDINHLAEELADTMIRILDLAEYLGFDMEKEIATKFDKNHSRPFKHGKKC